MIACVVTTGLLASALKSQACAALDGCQRKLPAPCTPPFHPRQSSPAPHGPKAQVARPRPDFVYRCWPSTLAPVFSHDGTALCEEGVAHQTIKTGMRSFPSGEGGWRVCPGALW